LLYKTTEMKNINLTKLIITVFAISWLGVLPSLLIAYNIQIPKAFKFLEVLMTLGPILGTVIFIYSTNGKQGLKNLFKRLFFFKAKTFVILIAIVSPVLISYLASTIGFSLSNTNWPESFDSTYILSNGLMIFAMYLIVNT